MLAAAHFMPHEPVAIVTEGLLTYLNREEKKSVAGNIYALLKKTGGVWITPDVSTKSVYEGFDGISEDIREAIQLVNDKTGRDMVDAAFDDEKEISEFFAKVGFDVEDHPHSALIEQLSSTKGIDRKVVAKLLQKRKTLVLVPKNT